MRLAQGVLILALLAGIVTGPWAGFVVQAQPASPEVTREGTILSINRGASSFTMSTGTPPRDLTVLARGFTAISVARQGTSVAGSFASLAVGDHIVVHMMALANGQALAVAAHVVSRAAAGGPAGATQTGTTSGASSTSGTPSRGGSSGSGVSVDASGRGGGAGVSVDANARGGGN